MNIVLSGVLQKYTRYKREHTVEACTVREAISALVTAFPALHKVLFDPVGDVRKAHTVFLNGAHLSPDQLDQNTSADDRLEILTAIAGG